MFFFLETKNIRQSTSNTYCAFCVVNNFYRKCLQIYITIQKRDEEILIIKVYFFATNADNNNYYCILQKEIADDIWTCKIDLFIFNQNLGSF